MSTEEARSPHESEPLHVLIFYSFLSGFADLLLEEQHEAKAIDWYRDVSGAKSEEFARSHSAESELQIASALESYLRNRVYLLDGDEPRSRVSSVIQDPVVTANLRQVG